MLACIARSDLLRRLPYAVVLLTASWNIVSSELAHGAEEPLDFTRDVRPILAAKCFACHGPDEEAREADLRLDTRAGATADLGDYRAVVPGKPAESELIARVESDDAEEQMPPPDSKLEMSQQERVVLRRWIAEGAPYDRHWAFDRPTRPRLPTVGRPRWLHNPIDAFVLARMEKAGLQPSPPADRATLVRRIYLDMIGMPPTLEQADAFIHDPRPDAYERLVDELLASPHYGERWARPWLDLARYADTNGYEKDRPRSIWPYRDWVIRAFNADMPFDQFTIEQLAGDLLPNRTRDQLVATGFHRNTMFNEEGGVDTEQFRYEAVVDRVNTTGTVWLGMTVGCAQCHSHKYDPISQVEYYRLFAFFNNADEPKLKLPDPDVARRQAEHDRRYAALVADLASKWPGEDETSRRRSLEERFQRWLAEKEQAIHHWEILEPQTATALNGTTFDVLDDQSLLAGGDLPNQDIYQIAFEPAGTTITAIRLETLPHEDLPASGPGRSPITVGDIIGEGDFLLSEIEIYRVPNKNHYARSAPLESAPADWERLDIVAASASYAKEKSDPRLALDGNLDTGWRIGTRAGESHHAVFAFAEPVRLAAGDRLVVRLNQSYIHNMILGRFRISVTNDSLPVVSSGLTFDVERDLHLPRAQRSAEQRNRIRQAFLWTAPELAKAQQELREFRKKRPQTITTLVIRERRPADARTAHRHDRGEYLKPKEVVEPGVPAFLHGLSAESPPTRLTLARWLVDPANPLVARVVMNRQWQEFFGRGIVRTSEDFGTQSSPPTHPDLLDYLAVEFVQSGWSLKRMHRLIVTSATYRQSSVITPERLAKDPDNTWLARAPRLRLDAETLRDTILSASGLLTPRIGGPSVFPPQPAGVTSLSYGALQWQTATGADRFRRGLYTFAKRTSPYAMFTTFDGPTRETCIVRRGRSNTPLQALTILNDVVVIEAAQELGRSCSERTAPPREVLVELFRRLVTRFPIEAEAKTLLRFYDEQQRRFADDPKSARDLCGCPDGDPSRELLARRAAWTAVARVVINLDETLNRN